MGAARRSGVWGDPRRTVRAHKCDFGFARGPACVPDDVRGALQPRCGGGVFRQFPVALPACGERDSFGQREFPPLAPNPHACGGRGMLPDVFARLLAGFEPNRKNLGGVQKTVATRVE